MAIPIESNEQVQSGATLDAASGGTINATEINGVPIPSTNSGTAGKVPVTQGDGSAAWVDPLVQGVYPPTTRTDTGGISGGPINPVLVGGSDYAGSPELRNLKVDSSGNIYVQATLAAETTKVIGVTRTADGAGNLITTNSTTYSSKFGWDTNLLGTLGTAFSTAGKVDVKGADGDVFVRQTTATNLKTQANTYDGSGNAITSTSSALDTNIKVGGTSVSTSAPLPVTSIAGPAGVTPVFIAGASNPSVGSVTTLTINQTPSTGNAVVITCSFASASVSGITCKDNNNNVLTSVGAAGGANQGCMFYGFAVSGATSYTLTWTTSCNATMSLAEYSLVGGFGKTNTVTNLSTTTPNGSIATPSSALSVIVGGFPPPTNGSAFTFTNNVGTIRTFNNGGNIGNNGQGSAIADTPSLGAGVSTMVKVTLSTSEVLVVYLVELLPAGSAFDLTQIGNAPVSTAAAGVLKVGVVGSAAGVLDTTKGTQITAAVSTQDMKDSGRTFLTFTAQALAGVTSETLISTFNLNKGGTVTGSTGSYTITSGKTLRIQNITYSVRAGAGTVPFSRMTLRSNTAGATTNSSATLWQGPEVFGIAATTGVGGQVSVDFPDGLEIAGNGTISIGMSHLDQATTNVINISIVGYEY